MSLSGSGPRGIDALQQLLSNYFSEMIAAVEDGDGDIYQFGGDSIVAYFEQERGESDEHAAIRAAACAGRVQHRLRPFREVDVLGQSFTLSSRVGVSFGDCYRIILGEAKQWLHPALLGEPLAEAIAAEKRCAEGEVMLGPRAAALLPRSMLSEGSDEFRRLALFDQDAPASSRRRPKGDRIALERCSQFLHPELLRKGITPQQGFAGDFRDTTCMFVRVTSHADVRDANGFTKALNTFFIFAQRESLLHHGVLLLTDFTDKGNVLHILFGAPTAQENKEVLACHLATKLVQAQSDFPFVASLSVGIATGPAYWGEMGASSRKGSWALGEVVNLAARLMTHGDRPSVLVDSNTQRKVQHEFATVFLEDASLKGVSRPVPVYSIESLEKRALRTPVQAQQSTLVGRKHELQALTRALRQSSAGLGRVCIMSGEPGIGKSRLAARVLQEAQLSGVTPTFGVCYSYEAFSPFFPWRHVLMQLLQLPEEQRGAGWLDRIKTALATLDDVGEQWAPVLARILGLPAQEDKRTEALDARQKNRELFRIITRLLERRAALSPLLLLFEDAHWADRISLHLLQHVCSQLSLSRVMVLVTLRPGDTLTSLLTLDNVEHLELAQLGEPEVRALLRLRLGLESPDPALEDLLIARVQGNPFFIESLVQGLTEQGLLTRNEDGKPVLSRDLGQVRIPESIQDVVLNRIDLLPERENLVVKVASVVGRVFDLDAVQLLVPQKISALETQEALASLTGLGLILSDPDRPSTYSFKHALIRDVAYNTLLVTRREQLHRSLAQYLETRTQEAGVRTTGVLAYHYLAGADDVKGLEYTLLTARAAKHQYASEEAKHHYGQALLVLKRTTQLDAATVRSYTREVTQDLAETRLQVGDYGAAISLFERCIVTGEPRARRAEIHVGLGRAYQEMGDTPNAIEQLERALLLLGRAAPRSLLGLGWKTLLHGLLHLLSVMVPGVLRPVREERLPLFLKQLTTLISLIKIYFFADLTKVAWATLVAMNMASRAGSDYARSLANCYYGTLLFGAGLLGRSRRYLTRALQIGRECGDAVAEGVALNRLGTLDIFCNEPTRALAVQAEAMSILRRVGERWEVQTCLMMLATANFLVGRFHEAERYYLEMGALGLELNAAMHQGWAHAWVPMCRYLRGEGDAQAHRAELERGLEISVEVNDVANQCACLNHLANLAVREYQVEEAAQAAVRAFDRLRKYHVLVPFLQIGLVDVTEAALFALEHEAKSVPRAKLRRIVRFATFKARVLAKAYPYLKGPALRVSARAVALNKGPLAAEPIFNLALAAADAAPNPWERGVTYHDAAATLLHRRPELLRRGRETLHSIGAVAELRRLDRLELNAPAVAAAGAPPGAALPH